MNKSKPYTAVPVNRLALEPLTREGGAVLFRCIPEQISTRERCASRCLANASTTPLTSVGQASCCPWLSGDVLGLQTF